jgi:3-ketosteroid 9alpha-monooxygenase subunit A
MAKTADYGLGEFTFPRGWFMVARASDVTKAPKPLRYFGRDLVAYRGESGRVVVLDAYCPHMKAHLGAEQTSGSADRRIEGDSIRCPYHSWRFGPDGRCNEIPYFDGPIPPAAKVRSYPVEERLGCIFIWHDTEELEPNFVLPDVPEWDDPQWVLCEFEDLGTLPVHPQEIVDNIADTRHFGPIHGQRLAYFDNQFDGVVARQRSGGGHETMASDAGQLDSDAFYTGPGVLVARYASETDAVQIILHTPVEDGVTQIWHGLFARAQSVPHAPADLAMQKGFYDTGLAAFAQDFAIWKTKEAAIQILRVPTDGPFQKARAWYAQFYNPRARAHDYQTKAEGLHKTRDMAAHPSVTARTDTAPAPNHLQS